MTYYKHWKKMINKILADKGYYFKNSKTHKQNCRVRYEKPNVNIEENKIYYKVKVLPIAAIEEIDLSITFDEE